MRRKRMIEVVASGPPGSRIVKLRAAGNKAFALKLLKGTQDRASAGAGFSHQGAHRREAREVLVRFIGK